MVAGLAVFAVSCGYVGDPMPPALNIPQPVQDLSAQQVESRLEINFTLPGETTDKLPVKDISAVELRLGPAPVGGWNLDAWASAARPVALKDREPGPAAASVDVTSFVGQEIVLAVRSANRKGRASAWSNLVSLRIEPPVQTPAAFTAASAPAGALLRWTGFDGPVIVYRDDEVIGEGRNGTFADETAVLGRSYRYQLQARGENARGKISAPVSLTIEDRFPPAAPSGLTIAAGAGTVEVSWNPNPEPDILGYTILRAVGDGPFVELAGILDAPAYTDRSVARGLRYRYKVGATDLRGNQSPTSQEVEMTVP